MTADRKRGVTKATCTKRGGDFSFGPKTGGDNYRATKRGVLRGCGPALSHPDGRCNARAFCCAENKKIGVRETTLAI